MINRHQWPFIGLIGCILLFIPLFVNAFTSVYNGDESLLFFVISHSIWHRSFWESTGSMIAGMPWYFVENWFWIRWVQLWVGPTELNHHIELYGRLPMLYYFTLTAASGFYTLKWLSRSAIFALLMTVGVFIISPLSLSNLSEYRIHPCGLAYHMAAWAGFTWYITGRKNGPLIWAILACIAPWAHVYAFYGVLVQLIILGWLIRFQKNELRLPKLLFDTKVTLLVTLNLAVAIIFFMRYMQKGAATAHASIASVLFQGVTLFTNWLLYPSGLFWAALLIGLGLYLRNIKLNQQSIKLSAIFLMSQWLLGCLFCAHFLASNYRALDVMPRYVTLTLTAVVFGFGLLLRTLLQKSREESFSVVAISILICWATTAGFTFKHSVEPPKKQTHPFKVLQSEILALPRDLKIQFVSGLTPNDDHSLITHQSGGFWGHLWQVYVKGALDIASIRDYSRSRFGGLKGVDCKTSSALAVYQNQKIETDSALLADLCNLSVFKLRVAPASIQSQN